MDSRIVSLSAVCVLLALSGCAAIQRSDAGDTERMLAAAGFQMKFADDPAKSAKVSSLPQRKLTRVPGPAGKPHYVYADATYCQCLYAGTEAAYDRYQKLAIKSQVAEEQEDASMNWGGWGGWGPWY